MTNQVILKKALKEAEDNIDHLTKGDTLLILILALIVEDKK